MFYCYIAQVLADASFDVLQFFLFEFLDGNVIWTLSLDREEHWRIRSLKEDHVLGYSVLLSKMIIKMNMI